MTAPRVLLVEPDAERRARILDAVVAARGTADDVLIVGSLDDVADLDLDPVVLDPIVLDPPDLGDLPAMPADPATCKHSMEGNRKDRRGRPLCDLCGVRLVVTREVVDKETGVAFGRKGGEPLRVRSVPKATKAERKAAKRAKRDARRAGGVRPAGSTLDDLEVPPCP